MSARSKAISDPDRKKLSITRVFNAPRELVWQAWASPEHIGLWWGPDGFTTTIQKMDFREGGEWIFVMHGPDGTYYANRIVFNRIVQPELITYTHFVIPLFFVEVGFEKQGEKTRLEMVMRCESQEQYEDAVERIGIIPGLEQTIGRLDDYVREIANN